ncbi:hypothetical protein FA95DRAFT_1495461 [Auriscalpium vulgare]|uniref:Uncharacterized protein n=1 Tax=Auriscalpium vulgare TaxID=40419 RepID=A0ACB8RMR0_9AGAM|nr:hypothetical protein FA95DRAFT_1495461 [Auriscalpium vulgare]
MRPEFRKNGLKPVVSDRAEFIANSILGSFNAQSFWFGEMHWRSICPSVRFARSVIPSDCG